MVKPDMPAWIRYRMERVFELRADGDMLRSEFRDELTGVSEYVEANEGGPYEISYREALASTSLALRMPLSFLTYACGSVRPGDYAEFDELIAERLHEGEGD